MVHCWIINSDNKFLFQFRKANKKSQPRAFDASVGGKVSAGETYDEAVVRETKEELGIKVEPIYVGKYFVDLPHEYKFISVYYTFYDGGFKGWEKEAECLEWMSREEYSYLSQRFPYLFTTTKSFDLMYQAIQEEKGKIPIT